MGHKLDTVITTGAVFFFTCAILVLAWFIRMALFAVLGK